MLQKRSVPAGPVNVCTAAAGTRALELLLRRVVLAERLPAPCVRVRAAGLAAGDVLERAHVLVDVDEVEEDLQQVLVVVVAVPALRRDALGRRGLRHRVPDVDVLELRPHLEVRVRDVEQAVRRHDPEPRVVRAELDAVALEPHDELLARPDPHVLAARGEFGLGRGDEAVALLLERAASRSPSGNRSANDRSE